MRSSMYEQWITKNVERTKSSAGRLWVLNVKVTAKESILSLLGDLYSKLETDLKPRFNVAHKYTVDYAVSVMIWAMMR